MNRPTTVVLNPLKWSSLTWLVFLPWLALAVLANLGATEHRYGSGARVDRIGWPLSHTEASYPANSASAARQETSYLIAVVDLLAMACVQFSIIAVAPRWPQRFSVRTLLLLTTLVAIVIAMGRVVVADKVFSALAMNAADAIVLCLYFSPVAVWFSVIVFRRFWVTHLPFKPLPIAVAVALTGLIILSVWDHVPGTYQVDGDGFPYGTGKAEHYYDSGALMAEEWYRAGVITKKTWYRPDGTRIATSVFDKRTGGVGLYLRQDGGIRCRMPCRYSPSDRDFIADGTATYFAPDGTVEKSVEYRDGSPAEETQEETNR